MIQLLFLDMEGTLFVKQRVDYPTAGGSEHHSLWSRLMYELGPGALEDDAKTIAKWESGEYRTYLRWCDASMRVMQRHGLTRSMFDRVLGSIDYNPGVRDTIAQLHAAGVRTAIVSGGFMAQARRAQIDHQIHHAYAAVDVFWDEDQRPIHWNIFPSDFEGKVDFVDLMIREYGVDRSECGFVGDGRNDVHIARRVGVSFALDGHPQLREAATHSVEVFSEILNYLT